MGIRGSAQEAGHRYENGQLQLRLRLTCAKENYNVIVVSPRNYFLFTPLLPSCTTGTIEHRSIMEPIRNFLRHKKAAVKYYEAEATKIDYAKKVVYIDDNTPRKSESSSNELPFDMLVVGVGAENATFGTKGVP